MTPWDGFGHSFLDQIQQSVGNATHQGCGLYLHLSSRDARWGSSHKRPLSVLHNIPRHFETWRHDPDLLWHRTQ
ncbi:unnamed protein product [Menidia menidia]|uniref:(Atlantic silverside) hypothetical protein n=1 Tax=Menidia menidia TaxID=238744 RepID=A0A8S4B7Z5_9TELE|nr:unnamed protein product [Menidia menidia]